MKPPPPPPPQQCLGRADALALKEVRVENAAAPRDDRRDKDAEKKERDGHGAEAAEALRAPLDCRDGRAALHAQREVVVHGARPREVRRESEHRVTLQLL
jgi:hypothetical protein